MCSAPDLEPLKARSASRAAKLAAGLLLLLSACGQQEPPCPPGLTPSPADLGAGGGEVALRWSNPSRLPFTVQATPPLAGFPATTTADTLTVRLPQNDVLTPQTYTFTLAPSAAGAAKSEATVVVRPQAEAGCMPSVSRSTARPAAATAAEPAGTARWDLPHVPGRLLAYAPDHLSLQRQPGGPEALANVRLLGSPLEGWSLLAVPEGREADSARLLVQGGYAGLVQPEYLYRPAGLSTPPANAAYLSDQQAHFRQLGLEQAWARLGRGCGRPVVAVLDTGFFAEREDLRPNLTDPSSWLDVAGGSVAEPAPRRGRVDAPGAGGDHGTGMAGLIASTTNGGSVLAGAAYNLVRVLPVKVFDDRGLAGSTQIAQALEYATGSVVIGGQTYLNPSPAQVVNLSLALNAPGFTDPYLEGVLKRVRQRGAVVVAASGNADASSVGYPASSPNVIAVGAANGRGERAKWGPGFGSSYGEGLDFLAPGSGVALLTGPSARSYASGYGTSNAAALVSAVVGLYLYQGGQTYAAEAPWPDPLEQVRRCLVSASQGGQGGWRSDRGYGLIDVARVVDPANPDCYPKLD